MRAILRHQPSPAMVVACIALTVSLGGTSYAAIKLPANSVGTKQLKNGAVTKKKIAKKTITALKGQKGPKGDQGPPGPSTGVAGGDLTGNYPNPSIAPGAVTGAKVANNTLGATQVNEAALDYGSAGCKLGLVHSFARIKGQASMPSTYTTNPAYVDFARNCSGGTTEVRRAGGGQYYIRFNGDPAALALAVSNFDSACPNSHIDQTISVRKVDAGGDAGAFEVIAYPFNGIETCLTFLTF